MYLYGAGGHAKVIWDIIESNGGRMRGLFDDNESKKILKGFPVNPGIKVLGEKFPLLDEPLIISVGSNILRAELAQMLNTEFGKAIHKSAIISPSATIGEGTVILQGAIVQAEAKIGKHVLVNTSASIDHDNIIGDYVHISPKAALCGHVEVDEGTHVGAGAVIIPKIKIGKWCVIGAGTVVIRDIPDYSVAVGNPARILPCKAKSPGF